MPCTLGTPGQSHLLAIAEDPNSPTKDIRMSIGTVLQGIVARTLLKLPDSVLVRMSGGAPVVTGGRTLDARFQFLAHQARNQPKFETLPPALVRVGFENMGKLLDEHGRKGVSVREVGIDCAPDIKLKARHYLPPNPGHAMPMIVWFHQGGCVIGSLDAANGFCQMLADEAHVGVLSVDYRMAPENRFPAAVDDALAAFRWARAHAGELHADPARIAVGGDSAGGYLAATVCQGLKQAGEKQPALQLLIYPNVDATMKGGSLDIYAEAFPLTSAVMDWFYSHYLNDQKECSDWRVSPALNPDLAGLAPARIYAAGFDPLLDQGAAYAEKLKQAGVAVSYHCFDALAHAFTMMGGAISTAATANHRIAHETGHALRSIV